MYAVSNSKTVQTAGYHDDKKANEPAGGSGIAGKPSADANSGSGAKSSQSLGRKTKRRAWL
jgi:hypothetical protein